MSQPWFDPQQFGMYFGAIGGGVGGSLAGMLGAITGILAPRGRGKVPVIAAWVLFMLAGTLSLALGVVALVSGQPYGIWYPLLLVGVILEGVCTPLLFAVVLPVYRMAEARKLAAEEIRSGPGMPPAIRPE
jgi:hypothetical protein